LTEVLFPNALLMNFADEFRRAAQAMNKVAYRWGTEKQTLCK